jgi:pimeloyl-ACP methyl ester carboxylesterase
MDALGLPSAVLVGSSSGRYVAQQVSISSPERVRGLVLVGSPRSLRGRTPFADEVDRLTDPISRAWVKASLTWFPRFHDVPEWYIEARVDDGVRMPARVWRQALAGLTEATPPTDAGTIDVPTLIIGAGGMSCYRGPTGMPSLRRSRTRGCSSTPTPGPGGYGSGPSGWPPT